MSGTPATDAARFVGDALVGEASGLLVEMARRAFGVASAARASSNVTAFGSWFSSLITKLRVVRLTRFRGRLASMSTV